MKVNSVMVDKIAKKTASVVLDMNLLALSLLIVNPSVEMDISILMKSAMVE